MRIGEDYGQRHRSAGDQPAEQCRVQNPSIDRVRIDVVGARNREMAIEIHDDSAFCVAKCAADVHVGGGVGGDEPRVVSAPRSCDVGDRSTRAGAAEGDDCHSDNGQIDRSHPHVSRIARYADADKIES